MSRFEFHPVTREPYRQEPPEQVRPVSNKLPRAVADEQAPARPPSQPVEKKREGN
jgi:hypothetical protein